MYIGAGSSSGIKSWRGQWWDPRWPQSTEVTYRYLEDVLLDLEEELEVYDDNRPGGEREQLKMLQADQEQPTATAHPVLQTYTVGLSEVRGNMKEWEGAIRKELTSLFETTKALRRTTVKEF